MAISTKTFWLSFLKSSDPKMIPSGAKGQYQNIYEIEGEIQQQARSVGCLVESRFLLRKNGSYELQGVPKCKDRYKKESSVIADSIGEEPSLGFGTAFLVADGLVLTAGRSICKPKADEPLNAEEIKTLRVVFGFHMEAANRPAPLKETAVSEVAKIVAFSLNEGDDWALLELKKNPEGISPLPIDFTSIVQNFISFYVLGHPLGLPLKSLKNGYRTEKEGKGEDALQLFDGTIGSPVFDGASKKVVGIVVGRNQNLEKCQKIATLVMDQIQRALQQKKAFAPSSSKQDDPFASYQVAVQRQIQQGDEIDWRLVNRGDKAREWRHQAQKLIENELFKQLNPSQRGKLLLILGKTLHQKRDFEQALEESKQALAEFRKAYFVSNAPDIATALNAIGENLFALHRYADALPNFMEALTRRKQVHESTQWYVFKVQHDHPDLAESLNNLGVTLALTAGSDMQEAALGLEKEGLAMWERLCKGQDHPGLARSLHNVANELEKADQFDEGEILARRALEMLLRLYPHQDHLDVAAALATLGRILFEGERYKDALKLLQEAVGMFHRLHSGRDHLDSARALNSFSDALLEVELGLTLDSLDGNGETSHELEGYDEALNAKQRALEILLRLYPDKNHGDLVGSLNNMSSILHNNKLYKIEYRIVHCILEMNQRLYPRKDHADIAHALDSVGKVEHKLERYTNALKVKQQALEMWQRLYPGQNQYQIVFSLRSFSKTLFEMKRYDEAFNRILQALKMWNLLRPETGNPYVSRSLTKVTEKLYESKRFDEAYEVDRQALRMWKHFYPDQDNTYVLHALDNLGRTLHKLQRYPEAIKVKQQALVMLRSLCKGQEHDAWAFSLNSIGISMHESKKYEEALQIRQQTLAMWRRLYLNQDHNYVAHALHAVGQTLDALKRHDEALVVKQQALEMWRRVDPFRDPNQASVLDSIVSTEATLLDSIGSTLHELKRYDKALKAKQQALEIRQRLCPWQDSSTEAHSLDNVALTLNKQKRHSKALKQLQQALAMRRRLYADQDHVDIARTLEKIGTTLHALKRDEEAYTAKLQALEMWHRLYPGQDRAEIARSLNGVGAMHHALNRYQEALKPLQQALEMRQRLYQGQDHMEVARSFKNIGETLHELKQYPEALKVKEKALNMLNRLYPDQNHPDKTEYAKRVEATSVAMKKEPDRGAHLFPQPAIWSYFWNTVKGFFTLGINFIMSLFFSKKPQ